MATPPQPAPPLPTPAAPGLQCAACGTTAVVNWQRRPTETEVAEAVAVEENRRAQLLLLADPQQPAPVFGPLPTADDMLRPVYACPVHAISLDAASHVHQAACTAPNPADLPGCDCTPETYPPQPPVESGPTASLLPDHWATGGA